MVMIIIYKVSSDSWKYNRIISFNMNLELKNPENQQDLLRL